VKSFPTSLLVLFGFLLAPVVAGFLASTLCSLSILRHHKPPWFHASLSIALGIFSSLLVMFRRDALHPSRWRDRISEPWDPFSWLAFTLAYWRGHWKVRPRHRRHFPTPSL
jgi:hypothetical protein